MCSIETSLEIHSEERGGLVVKAGNVARDIPFQARCHMVKRILGGIGFFWGLLIVINGFISKSEPTPAGSEAFQNGYAVGKMIAIVLGGLMAVVGFYYLIRGGAGSRGKKSRGKNRSWE